MESRPDRFTALFDANALVPVLQRNLMLSFARAGCFRPRWSARILDEFERALPTAARDMTPEGAVEQRVRLERAFPEAQVVGWEALAPAFETGPDPADAHVMAAAQRCGAAVIVTANVKDFPASLLEPLDIEAATPDAFLSDAIDLDQDIAVDAVRGMRARLRRPELTAQMLVDKLAALGLPQTAALIAPYVNDI